jgi:hypothetical protein
LGSGVSAVLSTTTPEVTIFQPNSAYPDTAENDTSANTTPFQVSTSAAFQCGTPIDFTLTISFAGGSSVVNFSLPSCATPPAVINGTLEDSDPVQEGRLGRNGSPAFNTTNTFSVDVPANQTLVVVVEETNASQTPGSTYTLEVSGLVGNGVGPGPCEGGGGDITLEARVRRQGNSRAVTLRWSPADRGDINVLRDGVVVQTTADDGITRDKVNHHRGPITYQVCETDSGDCSNEVVVDVTAP